MHKVLKDTLTDTDTAGMSNFPVSQYQDGWCFRSDYRDANGVRKQVRRKFKTEQEAITAYVRFVDEKASGTVHKETAWTFGDAAAWWIAILKDEGRAITTLEGHELCLRLYAFPKLEKVALNRITPDLLREMYRELVDRGLATSTIAAISRRVRALMARAVAEGKLDRNVAKLVKPPKGAPAKKHVILSPEQVRKLLAAVVVDRLAACWILGIYSGMRRGELTGLRWRSVDFAEKTITVDWQITVAPTSGKHSTTVKTAAGERTLPLPDAVFDALSGWQLQQTIERTKLGRRWEADDYVFTTRDGTTYDPGTLSERIKHISKAAGVPAITLHALRHTLATNALYYNIGSNVLAPFLGHSSGAVTAQFYQHVTPEMSFHALQPAFDMLEPQ